MSKERGLVAGDRGGSVRVGISRQNNIPQKIFDSFDDATRGGVVAVGELALAKGRGKKSVDSQRLGAEVLDESGGGGGRSGRQGGRKKKRVGFDEAREGARAFARSD